ncbi:MAG TPA: hypothetical protein VG095_07750 [Chthoniobacterales bacterium]|nr:hypothetical protein [Chthoniobacterales bacterium]
MLVISPIPRTRRSRALVTFWNISLIALALASTATASLVDVTSPTTGWKAIRYGGANGFDPTVDQQTGSAEGDLVGNATHASVYSFFGDANTPSLTDGTLAFRLRLGADTSPAGFKTAAFVGIITDRASGKIDLFVGVNNSGQSNQIGIYNPGAGLNVSPSTTTIVSPALLAYAQTATNYNWSPVNATIDPAATSFDIDAGGENDYFLTFAVPFADIITQLAASGITGVDENTSFSYVIATSTQGNSLNQDLNGVPKNYDGSSTWAQLGALSDPTTPVSAVPEVEPVMGVALLIIAVLAHAHWRRRRAHLRRCRTEQFAASSRHGSR